MKNLFIFLNIFAVLLLTACGGSKYDNAINEVIKQEKEVRKEMKADSDEYKRDNAVIRVYDNGKYIQLAFYQPKDKPRKLTTYSYYEKLGDSYEKMTDMPGTEGHDRLGLYKKKPDYEEVKGKETKTKE
ncbi:cystatin-like fold lipoprotein [Bacillus velezensis]|uniref:cystatin-like fold lipoprotein n=1 Tax=Bacillus velezensis TaxID=492670 RepID=UPI0025746F1E|nr:cystatin-like fold lipoprotein [Bacillus velezensis]WJF81077.1 cystatin-like fold lipoprotein [Bacillus velezensis]